MIVFIDESIFEKQRAGGISRYFCELILELSRLPDLEVVLYVGKSSNIYLPQLEGLPNVTLCGLSDWMPVCFNGAHRKLSFIRYCFGRSNVVYHPSYYKLDRLIQFLAGGTVLTVYDLIYEQLHPSPRKKKISHRKRLQNRVDRIIAISQSTKKDLLAFNPASEDKIHVTHLAASLNSNADTGALEELADEKFFLFVGTRKGYKRGDLAIRAFAKFRSLTNDKEMRFLFVGGGAFIPAEKDLIESEGLTDVVIQRNFSDDDLSAAYRFSVCLLFPSDYEGFGLPVLEAMEFECPVIAQAVSSIPEVGGGWPYYLSTADEDGLVERMIQVSKLGRARVLSDKANVRISQLERFSWMQTAIDTKAVYSLLFS